jgi:hypothetical protein
MADNAVKRNKRIIQDASSFNAWVKDTETVVTFLYVDKEQCKQADNEMRSKSINPVGHPTIVLMNVCTIYRLDHVHPF